MRADTTAPCPVCQSPARLHLEQEDRLFRVHPEVNHRLYFCQPCGLYFQEDVDPQTLADYYPPQYYSTGHANAAMSRLGNLRQASRARSAAGGARSGRVLDIGCGRGAFLVAMAARGWEPVGMDWNATNAADVQRETGIRVVGGMDALEELEPESFDVVTMFHVLEHEQDPLALLGSARRLLAPSGRLVVGVPNAGSIVRRVMGRDWVGYDLPRHRRCYTSSSLKRVLGDAGFVVDRVRGRLSDEMLDVRGSLQLKLETKTAAGRSLATLATLAVLPALVALSASRRGSVLYVFAQPDATVGPA